MTKFNDKTKHVTSRVVQFGRSKENRAALAERISKNASPSRRLGGVSDMHIEMMETMTEDEIEELELRGVRDDQE